MRLSLKSLLVLVVFIALGAAAYMSYRRRPAAPTYEGYLVGSNGMMDLVRKFDPPVKLDGGGGGAGGPFGRILWRTYRLTSTQPINQSYFDGLRNLLVEDLKHQGIRIIEIRDLPVSNKEPSSINTRGFLLSWGFEILVDDHGYKGLVAIRLLPVPGTDAVNSGNQAELHENIVVFQKEEAVRSESK